MKAPDKIYIQTNAGETLSSKWTTIPFRDFENTEYIRKDALMELLLSLEARYSVFYLEGKIVRDVIDKINSL